MLGDSASGSHFGSLYAGIVLDLGSVLRWTRLELDGFFPFATMLFTLEGVPPFLKKERD